MDNIAIFGTDSRFLEIIKAISYDSKFKVTILDICEDFFPDVNKCNYHNMSITDVKKGKYYDDVIRAMYRDNKISWRRLDTDTQYWYFAMRTKYKKLIQKFNKVIFSNIPHEGLDLILAELAEELLIPWFAPWQAPVEPLSFQIFSNGFKKISSKKISRVRLNDTKFLGIRYKNINQEVIRSFQKKYNKTTFRNKFINFLYSKENIKTDIPSIKIKKTSSISGVIALHMQPELTTEPMAAELANPIVWIETLLSVYPLVSWSIREHPDNSKRYRGLFFKKYILDGLRSNKFSYIASFDKLNIDKFDVVATINGTIGFEALLKNKTVICHESAFYNDAPGSLTIGLPMKIQNNNKSIDEVLNTKNLYHGIVDPYYIFNNNQDLLLYGWKNFLKEIICY